MFYFLYHYHWQDFYRTWLYTWVTWRVSYKKQDFIPGFNRWGPCCLSFYFLCCPIMCLYALSFMLWCIRYDFSMEAMFGSYLSPVVCFVGGSCLVCAICVWWCPARILFCFALFFFVLYVASYTGFSICDCPFGILWRLFMKAKINLTHAHVHVIFVDLANLFWIPFGLLAPEDFLKLIGCPACWLWVYMLHVIPETHRVH